MKKIIGILFGICLLAGCSKNEVPAYSDLDKVYFYERRPNQFNPSVIERAEEMSYSFATKSSTLMEGRLEIKVRLQGRVDKERDRVVCAEVIADSTTAVEGTHYRLEEGVIKAGEYEGILPLTFYRTPEMKTEMLRIKLRIADSDDLKAGLEEEAYIRVLVSDILTYPYTWPTPCFGTYSTNKYQFIIDHFGVSEWPMLTRYDTEYAEGKYTMGQLYTLAYQYQEYYENYRANGGAPIYMDDNAPQKVEISFKSQN